MPDDVIQQRIDDLAKQQIAFQEQIEKSVEKRIQSFSELAMNTIADAGLPRFELQIPPSNVSPENAESSVADLQERVEELEQATIGFQLPISFRYRNDGAEGAGDDIHRLEFIVKATPYSSGTTFWPDDQWTPIPGADAVVAS